MRTAILTLVISLTVSLAGHAQSLLPREGDRVRYDIQIDFKKAYVSGLCTMVGDEGAVKASIVNEFGVSAIDFIYRPARDKVKIVSLFGPLDKWYIRLLLRKNLKELMHRMQQGQTTYADQKHHVTYTLTPHQTTTDIPSTPDTDPTTTDDTER